MRDEGQDRLARDTSPATVEKPHWSRIRRVLEQKIVPSLVIRTQSVLHPSECWQDDDAASDALVALAIQGREDQARGEIRELAQGGMSFERLQLGLLAPAANRIGQLWDEDSLSFVDATFAVGTLQRLMHFVALDLYSTPVFGMAPKSLVLFPEPGARHIFGVSMAARFFQHAGWHVDFLPEPTEADVRRIIANRHVDAIGLSINRTDAVPVCAEILQRLKRESLNRSIVAIGGGAALCDRPDLIEKLPVDAVLAAVEFAPKQTARLITEKQG